MNDEETVAPCWRPYFWQGAARATPLVGAEPEGAPIEQMGLAG